MMKVSFKKGLSYGTTSGVITSLGLLIGLYSTSASRELILAGLLTIAFADAFSDGLGIHISEESENKRSAQSIWEATFSTILAKMIVGVSFILPVIFFPLSVAVIIDIIWAILSLSILSYKISKQNNENPSLVLAEHLGIALLVTVGSFLIGRIINASIR
jgi:VIT1/CCC1 family predicted Fe2+/Mn2+ transporter